MTHKQVSERVNEGMEGGRERGREERKEGAPCVFGMVMALAGSVKQARSLHSMNRKADAAGLLIIRGVGGQRMRER